MEFVCEACGGTFESGWTEEERDKEAQGLWGVEILKEDCVRVCDDCFRVFMVKFN